MATNSVYLPNNYQIAFNCESVVPATVAIAKASAYAKRRKRNIYVPGIGHFDEDGNQVDPTPPDPEPIVKSIGNVTATGDDLNEAGDTVIFNQGEESTVTAEFDGKVTDATYKWTVRSGNEFVSISGSSDLKTVTLSGDAGGLGTVRCTVSSITASDSPKQVTLGVTVTEPSGPDSAKKTRVKK